MKQKIYARILLLIMVLQVSSGIPALALTGGPSQPEFQAFEPIGTTEMVNLPDGGFTYNIPLLDIGGYPLNLSYHSDISADMEASCVGLGWTINPGVINRNVRALPDDFSGAADQVKKEYNLKANRSFGASLAVSYEIYGADVLKGAAKGTGLQMGMNMGVFYNNYWGIGYEFGLSPSFMAGDKNSSHLTAGLGTSVNSQSGANFNANANFSTRIRETDQKNEAGELTGRKSNGLSASVATSINSRGGMKAVQVSAGAWYKRDKIENEQVTRHAEDGISSSATIDFIGPTYTPEITMPQANISITVNVKPMGLELFGSDGAPDISGYFTQQFLRSKEVYKPAYGLLYAQNGYQDENALMDFNREKDGAFQPFSTFLPIVNPGYDILSVNGQGIAGSFQLKRGDVPIFYDAKSNSVGHGGSLGLELGTGNTAHLGIDLKYNYSHSESKKWTSGNELLKKYNFFARAAEGYEPAYYKAAGEMAVESDLNHYNEIGQDLPVRANLIQGSKANPFNVDTDPNLIDNRGNAISNTTNPVTRAKRERRNQVISYLSAKEAAVAGLEDSIHYYPLNTFNSTPTSIPRYDQQIRKMQHISQIEAFQPDGMRYVYGVPAYNLVQKEVSFSTSTGATQGVDCSTGEVFYIPNQDNTPLNKLGQERYFNAVTTPPFAHTYLLSTVLSKDYEDRTGNGPTDDDFGSYTHIKYTRMQDPTGNHVYQWRVPFKLQTANYNPGFYSKLDDDKGSYIYGQKEILYVHSIESKTVVAEFTYTDRWDGYGVKDENGGFATHNLNKKLVKITLYSKPDRLKNGAKATPIKTVHFNYDYSLCPQTENSKHHLKENPDKGKLTLTSLYFTYGLSEKDRFSGYKFAYKNQDKKYSSKSYDRWGNYKHNRQSPKCFNPQPGDSLSNDEFPYAEQDSILAGKNAGTWSLNRIDLPSGGSIKVDYEAKHYAYVQDKPAMQMLNILGVKSVGANKLYGINSFEPDYLKVFFKLKSAISSKAQLKRDYFRDIQANNQYIYLKCYVKMNAGFSQNAKWEYVSLYSQIRDYGIEAPGIGYVILKPLPSKDDQWNPNNLVSINLNPICKYSLQYMQENLPEIAYDQKAVNENSMVIELETFIQLSKMWKPLLDLAHGFNNVMVKLGYAREIALDRSWIRLYEPNGMKFGGGSMVSRIVVEDNWGTMTGDTNADFRYGQEYIYTTETILSDGSKRVISSGVASYEPLIGGDENVMRQLSEVITEKRMFASDNVHYVEEPFGEVFMPSAQVIFGEVKVRNLQYSNVKRTATGHSRLRYFTAKDFPIKTRHTQLQKKPKRIPAILKMFKIKTVEHMNAAQGYLIETNDMPGKARSSEVFDEKGIKTSGVTYFYKTKVRQNLDNVVDLIDRDGTVKKGLLGVQYSLVGDARESKSKTTSGGIAMNLDAFIAGPLPITIPMPWPDLQASEERFRSMSFTKLVHKFGILDRTEAYDLGSTIATENLAWDAETGDVLLTCTYNEFEDPLYNLKLPAHWVYKGMQGAYQNIGFTTTGSNISSNGVCKLSSTTAARFFMPGDEVLLSDGNKTLKAWVLHVNTVTQELNLIDINGQFIQPFAKAPINIKITRSGYRNLPTSQIATLTSLENPIQNGVLNLDQGNKVLHAEAVEYSEEWQTFCDVINNESGIYDCFNNPQINPFVRNVRGEWRPQRTWLHLTERDKTPLNAASSTNIRQNGFYTSFSSFWQKPLGNNPFWRKNDQNWIWSATTTQTNPNGTALESQNRLGQYSAEILGYANQLLTGVASNSRYRQIAFEGFEDYDYQLPNCSPPRHFGEGLDTKLLTNKTWHTGKYALELAQKASVKLAYPIIENCPPLKPGEIPTSSRSRIPFVRTECECIQKFSPDPGKYVLTAWVKEGNGLGKRTYDQHQIRVNSNGIIGVLRANGPIIDGWQRIEGEFEIPPKAQAIDIELLALDKLTTVYFDDLRIFPFAGNMKNYVYDNISLKLLAELDANGYAKLYEYNQAGELLRMKQETERGIMTIQESNHSYPKK